MNLLKFSNKNTIPYSPLTELVPIEGGFVNLTEYSIDRRMEALLSFGPDFCLPRDVTVVDTMDAVMQMQNTMLYSCNPALVDYNFKEIFEEKSIEFDKHINRIGNTNKDRHIDRVLNQAIKITRNFFTNNKDVIIIQADKGNRTAIINTITYKEKMSGFIDKNVKKGIYKKVDNWDPILKHIVSAFFGIRKDIMKAVKNSINGIGPPIPFDKRTKEALHQTIYKIPLLYGTIKCHKEGTPVRPICASHNWYTSGVQKFIYKILKAQLGPLLCKNNINSIDEIVPVLYKIPVMSEYVWAKFDVQDMYTSIDRNELHSFLIDIINDSSFIDKCPISSGLFKRMIRFSLEIANYVKYEKTIYAQQQGLPQGAGDSGFYATLYLDYKLQMYNELLFNQNHITFWFKYMDDILIYIPKDKIDIFKNSFEDVTRLKLDTELEIEKDNHMEISFLDANIRRTNDRIELAAYKKPCASNRMVNYYSNMRGETKSNVINELINKILNRTCNDMLHLDLNDLGNRLENNMYPRRYINDRFSKCISKHIHQLRNNHCKIPLSTDSIKTRIGTMESYLINRGIKINENANINIATGSNKVKNRNRTVYSSKCVPFDKVINIIHKTYKMPSFTFRSNKNVYSIIKGISPQSLNKDKNNTNVNKNNLGITKCAQCDTYFILYGKKSVATLLEDSVNDKKSHLSIHMDAFSHNAPQHIYNINNDRLADTSTLVQIYKALLNTTGVSCHAVDTARQIPLQIRRIINKMEEGKLKKKLGIPMCKH